LQQSRASLESTSDDSKKEVEMMLEDEMTDLSPRV